MPYKDFYGREQTSVAEPRVARATQVESEERLLANIRADARRQVAHDPEMIRRQQEHGLQMEETYREYNFAQIFRTPINLGGRYYFAAQNMANEQIILGWLDETRDEKLSAAWFRHVIAENPELANQIAKVEILSPQEQKKRLARDHETFLAVARMSGAFGNNDANFSLVRQVLGSGFTTYDIQQAVDSGAVRLSPATAEEIDKWHAEATGERRDFLVNRANPDELRAAARSEAEQARAISTGEQANRELESSRQRDQYRGYRPLPPEIDSKAIKQAAGDTLKHWIRLYGNFQITARVRSVN